MRRPSPAVAIATVALFFSLTGAGFAASKYLITAKSQIAPSVLKAIHGKRGKPGIAGAAGVLGATGATGAAGVFSAADVSVVDGPVADLAPFGDPGDVGSSDAVCPAGTTLISGGYGGTAVLGSIDDNEPIGPGWAVVASNDAPINVEIQAFAVCAS